MVSWLSDGQVSGFGSLAAASGSMDPAAFLLSSPGSVDTQGPTRLQYSLDTGLNRIQAQQINLRITAADCSANSGRRLTATMFIAPAYLFNEGVVPNPAAILAVGPNLLVYRSNQSRAASAGAADVVWSILGPKPGVLQANTKYWVLVLPTSVEDMDRSANYVNDRPMNLGAENGTGRAISLWTNRTPDKPVITSPTPGSVVAAGVDITLSYTSNDPDAVSGGTDFSYQDRSGVQVQYAPKATPQNPSPKWTDLPLANSTGTLKKGWYIDGANENTTGESGQTLWTSRSVAVRCGSSAPAASKGYLPSGSWQLRLRTFDYGHPQPTSVKPLGRTAGNYTAKTFPAENTSPWSDPVAVTVSAQVPPPIPLSPVGATAVPQGAPITFLWQYRNTSVPPYTQANRTLQVRKVGETTWRNLVTGSSSSPSHVVPTAPFKITDDALSLTNWTGGGTSTAGPTLVSGYIRQQRATPTESIDSLWLQRDGLNAPAASVVRIKGRRQNIVAGGEPSDPDLTAYLLTSAGAGVQYTVLSSTGTALGTYAALSDWEIVLLAHGAFDRVRTEMYYGLGGQAILDIDSIEVEPYFQATNEYEWRVQVTDTDGVQSNYSETARWWMVPAPASGDVRPVPSSTIDAATLGCGSNTVRIFRRGGQRYVGELTGVTYVDYERVRDDISNAKIVVKDWGIDCGNLLSKLQTWAYEVVITRNNGYSVDRVWEGPITLLTYEHDAVTIQAKDVMAYPYRRIIRQKMSDTSQGDTVTSRAARVLQNAMAPDDPNVLAHMQVLAREDDARQYRTTPAYSRTAFEEIDDMAANAGLDYTVVGRAILLWGTKHRIGTLPEFKDQDLGAVPIVSEYGMSAATRYAVSDGNGIWGEATRGLDEDGHPVSGNVYGLIEMLSSTWASDSEDDVGTYTAEGIETIRQSFEDYAERSIADRYPPPLVLRVPDNTSLNPGAVVSIQQLVPGVAIPLRSNGTLRTLVQTQKLDSVKVVEEAGVETISVTMSPFTRDDAEAVAEEV